MRRNIAMISAGLTAFSVVILASVIYAYQTMAAPATNSSPAAAAPEVAGAVDASAASVPQASQNVSPQDAAALAAKYMNRADAYSVELTVFNGIQCYKVAFSSGDIAYVALNGQVLGNEPAAAAPVSYVPAKRHGDGGGRRGGGGSGGGGGGGDEGDGDGGGGD